MAIKSQTIAIVVLIGLGIGAILAVFTKDFVIRAKKPEMALTNSQSNTASKPLQPNSTGLKVGPQPSDEETEKLALQAIEQIAAHPDDPQNPRSVRGTSDEELASIDTDEAVELIQIALPYAELNTQEPRYLFALGRAAWLHDNDELAAELFLKASELGSPAADAYLARMLDDLEESVQYLQRAVDGGFEPAREWLAEAKQILEEERLAAAPPPNQNSSVSVGGAPGFSHFTLPDLIKAFYEGSSKKFASEPLIPLAYIAAINDALTDQGMLFMIENVKGYVRELDPALSFEAARKIQTTSAGVGQTTRAATSMLFNMFKAMAEVRKRGGTIEEEIVATNRALLPGNNSQNGGASYVTVIEAKQYGTQDGRTLALMYDDDPEAFRRIYNGMRNYVRQEVR